TRRRSCPWRTAQGSPHSSPRSPPPAVGRWSSWPARPLSPAPTDVLDVLDQVVHRGCLPAMGWGRARRLRSLGASRYLSVGAKVGGLLPRVGRRVPICGSGRANLDWSRGRASPVFPLTGWPLETRSAIIVGYLAETLP